MEKPLMDKDQLITATEVARNFAKVKEQAKIEPVYVMEHKEVSLVLLNYQDFENMYLRLQELEEEIILTRSADIKRDQSKAIPWRTIKKDFK
jgi:PHD/YefM family antitoxin component YafN of YafNO toxin-antitoxin module